MKLAKNLRPGDRVGPHGYEVLGVHFRDSSSIIDVRTSGGWRKFRPYQTVSTRAVTS